MKDWQLTPEKIMRFAEAARLYFVIKQEYPDMLIRKDMEREKAMEIADEAVMAVLHEKEAHER